MRRQYLLTERAHFMCPNMHFGMLLEIEKEYKEDKIKEILDRMAGAHPFLKALIAYEEGKVMIYQHEITEIIRHHECDADGELKLHCLLDRMQDAAAEQFPACAGQNTEYPESARHYLRLCHPRPGRSPLHVRHRCRHERRQDPADRLPG